MSFTPAEGSSVATAPPFSFGIRLGLVFIVQCACLSAITVLSLFGYISYSVLKLKRDSTRKWSTGTHVHYYFLSLLLSDLIQAIGGIMNVKWIADAAVVEGSVCTAQGEAQALGIFKQLGDVGVALASLAIGVHTFCVLVFRWRPDPSSRTAFVVISAIWIFLALNVGINAATHKGKTYWGDTQYWCWITGNYPVQRIVLEYLWLWMTALLNIILYVPLALVIKGIVVVEGHRIRFAKKSDRHTIAHSIPQQARDANGVAMQMLYYPAIYIITVLPIAIVRWRAFRSQNVPYPATVFSDALFASSGLFNVLLFTKTRPSLLPRRESQSNELPRFSFSLRSAHADELSTIPGRPMSVMRTHGLGRSPTDGPDMDEEWVSSPDSTHSRKYLNAPSVVTIRSST